MGVRSCNPRTILQLRTPIDPSAKRLSANGFPRKRLGDAHIVVGSLGFGDLLVIQSLWVGIWRPCDDGRGVAAWDVR